MPAGVRSVGFISLYDQAPSSQTPAPVSTSTEWLVVEKTVKGHGKGIQRKHLIPWAQPLERPLKHQLSSAMAYWVSGWEDRVKSSGGLSRVKCYISGKRMWPEIQEVGLVSEVRSKGWNIDFLWSSDGKPFRDCPNSYPRPIYSSQSANFN